MNQYYASSAFQPGSLLSFFVPKGFFLLLNGSGSKDGETASLSVPAESLSATLCLEFWYQMSGPSVPSLNLRAKTVCTLSNNFILVHFFFLLFCFCTNMILLHHLQKSSENLIWTRQWTQNPEWIKAQVNINLNGMQKASKLIHLKCRQYSSLNIKYFTCPQLIFTGHRKTSSEGFIAIDDITVREGVCREEST